MDASARAAVVAANILPAAKSRHGDRTLEIRAAAVTDGHGSPTWEFELMHRATIRVLALGARAEVRLPSIGLQLHDRLGQLVFAAGTTQLHFPLPALAAGDEVLLEFRLALTIQPSVYTLSFDAAEYHQDNPNLGTFFDRIGGLGPLTVTAAAGGVMPFYGAAQLPLEISYA